MAEEKQNDLQNLTFEEALQQLESIVENLEQGDVPLDQSIGHYERGEALRAHCQNLLKQAEDKVEKIRANASGAVSGTEPLDPQ